MRKSGVEEVVCFMVDGKQWSGWGGEEKEDEGEEEEKETGKEEEKETVEK